MELTIFGKKRQTKEGRSFMSYLTTLTKKDGEQITVGVKFRESCGVPDHLPIIIEVDKKACNLARNKYGEANDGSPLYSNTLWITEWMDTCKEYVDHSMDDFI